MRVTENLLRFVAREKDWGDVSVWQKTLQGKNWGTLKLRGMLLLIIWDDHLR